MNYTAGYKDGFRDASSWDDKEQTLQVYDDEGEASAKPVADTDEDTIQSRIDDLESMIATDGGEDYMAEEIEGLRAELHRRNN